MGTRRKWHPDHYQTRPPSPQDEGVYEKETKKLREKRVPPLGGPKHPQHIVNAGEFSEQGALLECLECGAEVAVGAKSLVTPCGTCGSHAFRAMG